MKNDAKYYICKRIDEPTRYFGLTLDEFVPVLVTVSVGALLGSLISGFVLAGLVWFLIKYCKKGQGTSWFINLLYWYLPLEYLSGLFFIKTPPSSMRHWLS